jgi:hypothetical protein
MMVHDKVICTFRWSYVVDRIFCWLLTVFELSTVAPLDTPDDPAPRLIGATTVSMLSYCLDISFSVCGGLSKGSSKGFSVVTDSVAEKSVMTSP